MGGVITKPAMKEKLLTKPPVSLVLAPLNSTRRQHDHEAAIRMCTHNEPIDQLTNEPSPTNTHHQPA